MKCWKCGTELPQGAVFCSSCGASQTQSGQDGPQPQYQPPYSGGPSGGASRDYALVLTIFSAVCAVVYGGLSVRTLFNVVTGILRILSGFYFPVFITWIFNALAGVLGLVMCILLIMNAVKRTPQNSDGLLVCMGGTGAALVVVRLIHWLFIIIFYHSFSSYAGTFFKTLFGAALTLAGIFLIERLVLGENPILGKNVDDLKADVLYTVRNIGQAASEAGAQASQAAANARAERAQQAQYAAQQTPPYTPGGGYASVQVNASRSLIVYILLTLVTCGFYSWYFIYSLARDVNIVCAGDGKNTPGLLKYLLLSLITCGIYSFFWQYSLGNRLADNAPRYGMTFQENGTTVLLWNLFGVLICGIGPLVGLHIIIKNTNSLCGAYNYRNVRF